MSSKRLSCRALAIARPSSLKYSSTFSTAVRTSLVSAQMPPYSAPSKICGACKALGRVNFLARLSESQASSSLHVDYLIVPSLSRRA